MPAPPRRRTGPFASKYSGVRDDDRPREKLLRAGAVALGDAELVAVVLGAGVRGCSALDAAGRVLAAVGGVSGLAAVSPHALMRTPGVGESRALRIAAALELGRRSVAGPRTTRPCLATPAAVGAYLLPRFGGSREERFGVLLLDVRHRVVRAVVISMGTVDASVVHPREVFRAAVEHSASALVLFHNHPSGDPSPSPEDLTLTRRLVEVGVLLGMPVVDHVVLGDGGWHSLRQSSPGLFLR